MLCMKTEIDKQHWFFPHLSFLVFCLFLDLKSKGQNLMLEHLNTVFKVNTQTPVYTRHSPNAMDMGPYRNTCRRP